ncbi:MAG: hypothetical protein FVQ78_10730, partial [Solirubrobacterales bacterium]|nr:hypothetical protein [Solirubrobacterales bacterium]
TANFNPAGTDTLVSNGVDVFLAKYDPSGNYRWAFNLDNVAGLDVANYIVNDEVGNVYLSAIITGTTDFNPGPGTDTLTNAGDGDIFIAKYDSAGGFLSVVSMGGPGFDLALGIEADALGNLFLTGVFSDTADFDPGVGITNLISNGGFEIFIAKYSTPPPPLAIAFIPDTNFRNFLVANYPTFMDANDSLLIDSAATLTGTLDCNSQNIADLTGVEYFVNITWLYCQINQLTSLPDLSANTSLTRLICSANQLTTLPDLSANTTLLWIYCQSNLLDSLPDLTNNTALTELRCHTNQLTALPNLSANIALTQLQCYNNQLTVLPDLSNNTSLVLLYCFDNQLTSLPDLSANTALVDLRCLNNKFDFSDARELRIADTTSTLTTYFYSPQNPFGMADTFNFNEGDTLILSIASQDSALSYQWFRGTDTITGATDTLLTIPNVTLADSGIYTCRSYGTALLFPSHMSFSPGISSFVSEPFKVNIFSGALTASISYIKNVSCNGVQDGEAAVTATGGTPPYTYQWDDPLAQTTDTAKYLLAGNYSVIVTDSAGAVDTAFVTITEPFVLTAIITGTNVTSCGGSDGAANLIVSGGTQPYTFNWLSGDTTEDLAGLSAGTYSVSVTDSNGCTANASVTISEPPAITLGIIGTDVTTCGGSNGTANLTVIGGVAPYTFIWSTGATTEDITSLVPGTYSVTVIDSN